MVIGVSAAGKRVMTSSSSPGIALKAKAFHILLDVICLHWLSTSREAVQAWEEYNRHSQTIFAYTLRWTWRL